MKSFKTEVLAGFTTFLTMSYIIVVNPAVLSTEGTGMSFAGVMTATVLISFISTLFMGLFAKLPFALAPGMGINAFFTYTLILGEGIAWPTALGMVFWSGIFFLLISLTPLRELIVKSIPKHLRYALAVGIGLFLSFIGLKNSFLIEAHPITFVQQAPFSFQLAWAIVGLLIITFFLRRNNPAAFLFGIVGVSVCALLFGHVQIPDQIFSAPDFNSVLFKLDIWAAFKLSLVPAIISLILTDLLDSLSTFIGLAESSNLVDKNGDPKNIKKALVVDAFATLFSSFLGTSATTTFIESSAGIRAGGRTGMSAIVCALCFLPFLFLSPLASSIPSYATGPVLIVVGFLMFSNVKKISFSKIEDSLPAFLIILLIPLSFSISQGIMWGFLSHVCLYVLVGRRRELHPMIVIMAIMTSLLLFA